MVYRKTFVDNVGYVTEAQKDNGEYTKSFDEAIYKV